MLPDSPKLDDLKSFSDQISRVDEAWQKGDFQQGSSEPQSVAATESPPVAAQESQPVAPAAQPGAPQQVAKLSVTVKESR
jgi:hypothetical protein